MTTAAVLNSNPFFAVWYLIDTVANGSRGGTGPLVAVLFGAALWSIIALTGARAMKGGFGGTRARRRPAPPACDPARRRRLPRARAARE